MGKILGLDYGHVRIGVALSDDNKSIAFGKDIINNNSRMYDSLLKLIQHENVEKIILGYPLNLKGGKTESTLQVERFEGELKTNLLENNLNIDVIRWDERLTSKMAEQSLIASGMKKSKRRDKSNLDIISSALILQSYLDSM